MANTTRGELQTYRQKRRFDITPEPPGARKRATGNAFVIQKHDASRLHYDLRLEHNGVMKSWAVTRGPSLVPGEKRLAVHVEDHPIEYNKFEGTIPQGQYGGGTVMIWDRGKWYPEGDPDFGLKKGHLSFRLEGKKLSGSWHLVRMRQRPGERQESWLLIKSNDEAARSQRDRDILEEKPLSVATGRTMEQIAGGKRVWHSNRPPKAQKLAASSKLAARTAVKPVKKQAARRLSHRSASRPRPHQVADPQGARLDHEVCSHRASVPRVAGTTGSSRRRACRRERKRRVEFFRAAASPLRGPRGSSCVLCVRRTAPRWQQSHRCPAD